MTEYTPIRPVARSGFIAMRDVVFAIFMRELKTRFGEYRLGYIWAIVEPMSFVLILGSLRGLVQDEDIFGIPVFVFFAIGYLVYQLFAKSLSRASSAISANKGLFCYRQVKPIDAVLARSLLELLVFFFALFTLLVIFLWYGVDVQLDDLLLVTTVIALVTCFALGFSLIVASIIQRFREFEKIVPVATQPLFFISGVFFSVYDFPQQIQYYLLFNPLLHAVELARGGFYSDYPAEGLSLTYLSFWSLSLLFIGVASHRLSRGKFVAS